MDKESKLCRDDNNERMFLKQWHVSLAMTFFLSSGANKIRIKILKQI